MKGIKKQFFWTDKSGRGFTQTFTLKGVQKAMVGERSWDDEPVSRWADFAEVGDEWENAANKITRIK